jgi:hypothetical protein
MGRISTTGQTHIKYASLLPTKSQQVSQPGSSFNFNKTPLAPLGTKALVYDDPATRASWAPHATDGYYVGPASNHYRCLRFYIPATRRSRFSDTWRLYPAHSQVPVTSQHDISIATAAELIKALGAAMPTTTAAKIKHIKAIQDLSSILAGARDSSNAYEYASMRTSTHPATTHPLPA